MFNKWMGLANRNFTRLGIKGATFGILAPILRLIHSQKKPWKNLSFKSASRVRRTQVLRCPKKKSIDKA